MGRQNAATLGNDKSLALAAQNLWQPLHSRVRQVLRERILTSFQHGQRFYSERELIQELGVSQPTIRRALTDLAKEGYLLPDPRRGFFVQHHADVSYVGLVKPIWESSTPIEQGSGYSAICRARNYTFVSHALHKGDKVEDILRSIQNKPSEERILMSGLTSEFVLELGLRLQSEGYQHVVIGSKIPGFTGSSVGLDHEVGVDQIVDHLTSLGHERIAFMVNEPKILLITSLRAETVQRRLEQRKLTKSQIVFCETQNWENSFEAAYHKTHELLNSKPRPTAIVPLSGVGAWAVLRYAIEHKIDVPRQLSIVSFDPMINAALLPVPMTELTFSQTELATKAIDLLWADSVAPHHANIASCLVVRKSTGQAPATLVF